MHRLPCQPDKTTILLLPFASRRAGDAWLKERLKRWGVDSNVYFFDTRTTGNNEKVFWFVRGKTQAERYEFAWRKNGDTLVLAKARDRVLKICRSSERKKRATFNLYSSFIENYNVNSFNKLTRCLHYRRESCFSLIIMIARGLNKKQDEVEFFLNLGHEFDALALAETWCSYDVNNFSCLVTIASRNAEYTERVDVWPSLCRLTMSLLNSVW